MIDIKNRDAVRAGIHRDPVDTYRDVCGDRWAFEFGKRVPLHMQAAVARYVLLGDMPGSFLEALLANDFIEAAGRADRVNQTAYQDYASFIINAMPSGCWGSPGIVQGWSRGGGLLGYRANAEATATATDDETKGDQDV
jgi:hypothetical protein